ncbi:ORF6N domain-containing protein [Bacteroides pyogenes]
MKEDNQIQQVESKIIVIRDTQVILDRHVAERYGVETKKINRFSCFFLRILFGSFR